MFKMSAIRRHRHQGTAATVIAIICFGWSFYVSLSLVKKLKSTCEKVESLQIEPNLALKAFRTYRLESIKNYALRNDKGPEKTKNSNFTTLNRTDYASCADFKKLPRTDKTVKENVQGNRGITFMKISIEGIVVDVVHKEASHVFHTIGDKYKISSARNEIEYLSKLRGLPGIPRLFGYCVKENHVEYFVERIKGNTLCKGNGTTSKCLRATRLLETIQNDEDPQLAALKVAYTTARLFKLLEERHLFMEDVSGINLMLSSDFEVFLVDTDSLIFYNKNRILSKLSCESDNQCLGPKGNLWAMNSLNLKIYKTCRDLKGMCVNGRCRGFDNSLHACGIAEWYLCRVITFFRENRLFYQRVEKVCACLRKPHPEARCTFAHAATELEQVLKRYVEVTKQMKKNKTL